MQRLTLIRHGQTEANAARRFAGWEDTPLTPQGEAMAQALAAAHAGAAIDPIDPTDAIDAIYSSPLQRARNTVAPLAERLGLTVQTHEGLKEYNCGEWAGRSSAEVAAADPEGWAAWEADPAAYLIPGGESGLQVVERARAACEEIARAHPGGHVVIASHKGTCRLLIAAWLGVPLADYRRRIDKPLCSVSEIEFRGDDGPLLRKLGDVSHLPPELQALAVAG
ncbi:MAG: histidine phosphatase family protein [Planctomycetota bacterium]